MKPDKLKILEVELKLDGIEVAKCDYMKSDDHDEPSDFLYKAREYDWYLKPCKKHLVFYIGAVTFNKYWTKVE